MSFWISPLPNSIVRERLNRFVSDLRAASAVEFALVSVPFLALLLFSLQAVILYFADAALETYADDLARGFMTGTTQQLLPTAALFKLKVCGSLPVLFDCNRLWVDVRAFSDFTNLTTSAPALTIDGSGNVTSTWGYAPGTKGNVVVLRMAYMWPVVGMPMGTLGDLSATVHQLSANSVLRTESY